VTQFSFSSKEKHLDKERRVNYAKFITPSLCCNYLVTSVLTLVTQLNCYISFSYAELFFLFFSLSMQLI